LGGFTGNVSLSCSGATSQCELQSLFGFHHGSNSAQITVTIKVGQHAAVGNYSLTLKGASGSLTRSVPLGLAVN